MAITIKGWQCKTELQEDVTNASTVVAQTRIPSASMGDFSDGIEEISFKPTSERTEHYTQGRTYPDLAMGKYKVSGTIKRREIDGKFFGMVAGSDKVGTITTGTSYVNEVNGTGVGTYDGATVTNLPKTKPVFKLRVTDLKDASVPITYNIGGVQFTDYDKSGPADGTCTENVTFVASNCTGTYNSSW